MKKGEIWIIDIGKMGGREQEGIRPAVVVADVVGTIATVIPCTANAVSLIKLPTDLQQVIITTK